MNKSQPSRSLAPRLALTILGCILIASMGAIAKSGSLRGNTPLTVQKVITRNQSRFESCYREQLKLHSQTDGKSLQGKVILEFELDSRGKILRSEIKRSTLKDPTTELCLIDHLKKLQFPGAPKGLTLVVEHVFKFYPQEQ